MVPNNPCPLVFTPLLSPLLHCSRVSRVTNRIQQRWRYITFKIRLWKSEASILGSLSALGCLFRGKPAAMMSSPTEGPHGEACQQLHKWAWMWFSKPRQALDHCSLSWQLDSILMRNPNPQTSQETRSQIPDPWKPCEMTNVCCLKPLRHWG